jgi:hypothetical protein
MSNQIKVIPIIGWVLIAKDDDDKGDEWHIAWAEPFSRKKDALKFAKTSNWSAGYRAVRGSLSAA